MQYRRLLVAAVTLMTCLAATAQTPIAGANVNMVSGTQWPGGDPYLQRQNEPSMAVSTRNSHHLLAGANDYRTVDIPFPSDSNQENGDSWVGLFKSTDGGLIWHSTLVPGYPQDDSAVGMASPLKNFAVATDPTVRAGTHGLFYYSGLAFNRGYNAPSAVFVAVFQDQNNIANADPFAYVGTALVDTGNTGQFIDKPWIAADVPRPGTAVGSANCSVGGKTFTSGNVYIVYSKFLGTQPQNNPHSQINFAKSADCGVTWSKPTKLSESYTLNQGTVVAIDPSTGAIHIAWRQVLNGSQPDAILYAASYDGGQTFTKASPAYVFAPGVAFDQNGSGTTFRTMALPALAVDADGRVYLAWSQRNQGPLGTARIMVSTLAMGSNTWTAPYSIDGSAVGPGHQFLPSLTFGYGKLMLVFYDQRDDQTKGVLQCPAGQTCRNIADYVEVRVPQGDLEQPGGSAKVFTPTISDAGLLRRHTLDVRGMEITPDAFAGSPSPHFQSVRISRYVYGSRPSTSGTPPIEQLQFNPPNLPMFVKGTRPFLGDYIDVAALMFVPQPDGSWKFNTRKSESAVFHATWTDNRDVRPPMRCDTNGCVQDWTYYTPVGAVAGTISKYDSTQTQPACNVAATGSRDQNVYTARITEGLLLGVRENFKPLLDASGAPLPRAFSVYVLNSTDAVAYYRVQVVFPLPAGVTASFSSTDSSTSWIDVTLPARSAVARTVFVTSSVARASVTVTAVQMNGIGVDAQPVPNGLTSTTVINPDSTNPQILSPASISPEIISPDIISPEIANPEITSAEVFNPEIISPEIISPEIISPEISNPEIISPEIISPEIANPEITNLLVANPEIVNPTVASPEIASPEIFNPEIASPEIGSMPAGGITDFTWKLTNTGNTTASYNAKLFLRQASLCSDHKCQFVLRRTYTNPAANGCTLGVTSQNHTVASIANPTFATPNNAGENDFSADANNATVSLGPGEGVRMTLRVFGLTTDVPVGGLKPVGVSYSPNTGQTVPSASLTITTIQFPVAIADSAYAAALSSVGGVGDARTWTLVGGALPAGLALNGATVSGTPPDTGSGVFTVQVADSPLTGQRTHYDRQELEIQVNRLKVTVIQANKKDQPGKTVLKGGDSATVVVTVANEGSAVASSVALGFAVNAASGSSASCSASSPLPTVFQGDTTEDATYTCVVSGNGRITFTAQANAAYVNAAGTTSVTTPLAESNAIIIDSTPPVVTFGTPTPAANTAGWNNTDVAIPFTVSDATDVMLSPGPSPLVLTTEGVGVNGSVTATDAAGNSATVTSPSVKIDKTPPAITPARTPLANANGWNNTPVTVSFACTDALSGVARLTNPTTVSTEGAGLSVAGVCTDKAGNSAGAMMGGINIDTTPPVINLQSPADGTTYYINSSITTGYTCTDTLSGIANCIGTQPSGASLSLTTVNPAASFTVNASDQAGNSASRTATYSVIYKFSGFLTPLVSAGTATAPSIAGTFNLGKAVPIKWQLLDANGVVLPGDLSTLSLLQAISNVNCSGPPPAGATSYLLYRPTMGATGGSTFRFGSNQYMFTWDTTYVNARGCYNLVATFADGRSYATILNLQ